MTEQPERFRMVGKIFNATSSLNDKKKIIRQLLCTDPACVLRKAGAQIWVTIITSSKHGLCLDHKPATKACPVKGECAKRVMVHHQGQA